MARLIVKSPYIKCGGGNSAGGYMRYIATRERVELIQDDRPPTRKQEQLIAKLVKDFPDARELDEYADYQEHPRTTPEIFGFRVFSFAFCNFLNEYDFADFC